MKELTRLARNAASLTLVDILVPLANLVFLVVVVRRLGVDGFGVYATAMTFLLFARTLGAFGLQRVLVRDVAQQKSRANNYLSSAAMILLPMALLLWLIIPKAANAFGYSPELASLLGLLGAALVGNAFARPAEGILRAFELMPILSAVRIGVAIVTSGAGVLLLYRGHGIRSLMILQVISVWTEGVFLLLVCHFRALRLRWNPSKTSARWLLGEGFLLFLLAAFDLVLRRADVLLLARWSGPIAVGLYVGGARLIQYAAVFPVAASGALFPSMSARWRESPGALAEIYNHALRYYSMYGFGIAVTLSFGSEPLLRLLFGQNYLPGAPVLRLLAWALAATLLSGPVIPVIIISRHGLAKFVPVAGALALLNILLMAWFIPKAAHLGAASAALVTALVGLVVRTWWIGDILGSGKGSLFSVTWRPALASLGSTAVFMILGSFSFWLVLLPAALVYVMVLIVLGAFTRKELDWAGNALSRFSRSAQS